MDFYESQRYTPASVYDWDANGDFLPEIGVYELDHLIEDLEEFLDG